MAEIPLARGLVVLVDDADLPLVSGLKWYSQERNHGRGNGWYARAFVPTDNGPARKVYMHRLLMPGTKEIDHKDGDGLNNQRHNLRSATRSQNCANAAHRTDGASRYRGVWWSRADQRWRGEIAKDGQKHHLGNHLTEEAAALAYNAAARELFGEFARLNDLGDPHGLGRCSTTPQFEPQGLKV